MYVTGRFLAPWLRIDAEGPVATSQEQEVEPSMQESLLVVAILLGVEASVWIFLFWASSTCQSRALDFFAVSWRRAARPTVALSRPRWDRTHEAPGGDFPLFGLVDVSKPSFGFFRGVARCGVASSGLSRTTVGQGPRRVSGTQARVRPTARPWLGRVLWVPPSSTVAGPHR